MCTFGTGSHKLTIDRVAGQVLRQVQLVDLGHSTISAWEYWWPPPFLSSYSLPQSVHGKYINCSCYKICMSKVRHVNKALPRRQYRQNDAPRRQIGFLPHNYLGRVEKTSFVVPFQGRVNPRICNLLLDFCSFLAVIK